ncbi:MAG TPA: Flp pilus assembly protein CpaB [Caulobacteraceae bacterium]|nr:Flp pilus assembly protein CpaB [Caulobacteraceae bacterium]
MNIRTIATLAVAILLGLVAVLLVRNYLGAARKNVVQTAAAAPMAPVVVAASPVARGLTLEPPLLKVVNYPADSVPAGSFKTVAELTAGPAGKRLALRTLALNEPVLANKVSGPGGKLNLSGVLTDGMRAVSFRSNDVAGVAGFVLPGDRVDILLTRAAGSGDQATTVTQVLAENVLVLGVDQSANDEADKPQVAKAVTVEVTPAQAQAISLAQSVGAISLALRHVADEAPLARKVTTVADLGFNRPAARAAGPARPRRPGPPTHEVRVTRGVETTGYPVLNN